MGNSTGKSSRDRLDQLQSQGVVIQASESVFIEEDVRLDKIEPDVVIGPGTKIIGPGTMIGSGTQIQGAAVIKNCAIGRKCSLAAGEYVDSVLLDGCETVGWARVRGHSAWEEESNVAHTVDTKMTVLGYKTTLGSLINFPNVMMLGGTSPRAEVGAEVGSGTINFNFLPFGATCGALIKPSTVIGSMESSFLSCAGAPVRYVFIGGHSSLIAPIKIGLGSVVAAKTRVNPGIYEEDKLIGGGNIQDPMILDVSKVKVLKDITPKYWTLVNQMSTALAFRKWCDVKLGWARRIDLDGFAVEILDRFTGKVEAFFGGLISYGDNIAKYLLSDDANSRPDNLKGNKELAERWSGEIKPRFLAALKENTGFEAGTKDLIEALTEAARNAPNGDRRFYPLLANLEYSSAPVMTARAYFSDFVDALISHPDLKLNPEISDHSPNRITGNFRERCST